MTFSLSKPRTVKNKTSEVTASLVTFDPLNSRHRSAFLKLEASGRQHSDLRFHLEGHPDAYTMMLHKLAMQACVELSARKAVPAREEGR